MELRRNGESAQINNLEFFSLSPVNMLEYCAICFLKVQIFKFISKNSAKLPESSAGAMRIIVAARELINKVLI